MNASQVTRQLHDCDNNHHFSCDKCYIIYCMFNFIQINFQKECGADNKCSSNLQLTAQFADEKQETPYPR